MWLQQLDFVETATVPICSNGEFKVELTDAFLADDFQVGFQAEFAAQMTGLQKSGNDNL